MFVKKVGFGILVVLFGIGWMRAVLPLFQRDAFVYVGPWWDFLRIYLIVLLTSTIVVSLWVIYELLFDDANLQRLRVRVREILRKLQVLLKRVSSFRLPDLKGWLREVGQLALRLREQDWLVLVSLEMEKLQGWLNTPVKRLWLSRETVILIFAGSLLLVATVATLVGLTTLFHLTVVAGFAVLIPMVAFILVYAFLWEMRKNRPSEEKQTEP